MKATGGVLIIGALALAAACSSNPSPSATGGTNSSSPGGGGGSVVDGPAPIPTRTAPPTTAAPVVTTPDGAPALVEYHAPTTFYCLANTPNEAQVTIGWNAPSATDVSLTLDGEPLVSGIQPAPPYQVPAGGPTGFGATVVFACNPASEHTIKATWKMNDSPPTERTITITKATAP